MADLFVLNFEGEQGAVTWAEEVQDLEPVDPPTDCYIDTSQHYVGTSCLYVGGYVEYNMEEVSYGANFKISTAFRFHWNGAGYVSPLNFYRDLYPFAPVLAINYYPDGNLEIIAESDNFIYVIYYYEPFVLLEDAWHFLEVQVVENEIVILIDDVEITRASSSVSGFMSGVNKWGPYNDSGER